MTSGIAEGHRQGHCPGYHALRCVSDTSERHYWLSPKEMEVPFGGL